MFPHDPQEPRLVAWIRNPRIRRTLILSTLWVAIAVVLIAFRAALLPFGVAVLLAFIIEPLVELVSARSVFRRRIPRSAAVLAVYMTTVILLWVFGSWAVVQITHELTKVGAVSTRLVGEVEGLASDILDRLVAFADENHFAVDRQEIQDFFRQNVNAMVDEAAHNASKLFALGKDVVGGAFKAIFGTFLVLMLTAVLSIDRLRIQRFFWSLVPPEYHTAYGAMSSGISIGLAGVVRGQVLICLTNGIFTFLGLWMLGVKLPLLLATVAAVFSLVPIFGSILSSIPIVAIALTDSFAKGFLALLWIVLIHLMEANVLNPKIMGEAAKIHPVLVVFSLIVGEQTNGLIGALFAVPIASVVLTVFQFLHRRAIDAVKETEVQPERPVERPALIEPRVEAPPTAPSPRSLLKAEEPATPLGE